MTGPRRTIQGTEGTSHDKTPPWAAVLAALAIITLSPSTVALAAGGEGSTYGHHVSQCAQDAGFDGMHNPGMHQGFSGVPADHECAPMP